MSFSAWPRAVSASARVSFAAASACCARFAFLPKAAARTDDPAENVVGELDPAQIETLLDAKEAPIDESCERARRACRIEGLPHPFLGDALAEARIGQELVFDEAPHFGRLVGERALVELGEDRVARSGEERRRDFARSLRDASVVEL